jgi:hypothetical protein
MNYVILKAKPYTRTRHGKFENVKGYLSRGKKLYHGTSAKNIYKILFEGIKPQESYHNFTVGFYEGERAKRVFVTEDLATACSFAKVAESRQESPAIVLEVVVPSKNWSNAEKDNKIERSYMLSEVKSEWIRNAYDTDMRPMTKTINSLTLKRFEKAGKVVFIPVSLEVLKKILKGKKNVRNNPEIR